MLLWGIFRYSGLQFCLKLGYCDLFLKDSWNRMVNITIKVRQNQKNILPYNRHLYCICRYSCKKILNSKNIPSNLFIYLSSFRYSVEHYYHNFMASLLFLLINYCKFYHFIFKYLKNEDFNMSTFFMSFTNTSIEKVVCNSARKELKFNFMTFSINN